MRRTGSASVHRSSSGRRGARTNRDPAPQTVGVFAVLFCVILLFALFWPLLIVLNSALDAVMNGQPI